MLFQVPVSKLLSNEYLRSLIYLIKTAYVIFYNRWIARFINDLSVDLTQRVLDRYLSKNYIFQNRKKIKIKIK